MLLYPDGIAQAFVRGLVALVLVLAVVDGFFFELDSDVAVYFRHPCFGIFNQIFVSDMNERDLALAKEPGQCGDVAIEEGVVVLGDLVVTIEE